MEYGKCVDGACKYVVATMLQQEAEEKPSYKEHGIDYDIWLDSDINGQILYGETTRYLQDHGLMKDRDFTIEGQRLIAGNSPSMEKSYDGRYRKDTYHDVLRGAFLNDVIKAIKLRYPQWDVFDPCNRFA